MAKKKTAKKKSGISKAKAKTSKSGGSKKIKNIKPKARAKIDVRTKQQIENEVRILRKQREANRMLTEARRREAMTEKGKKEVENALTRKRAFYNKRGIKNPSRLSMGRLKMSDYIAYENMLDSIIENKWINKSKYDEMIKKRRDWAKDQGYADNNEEADRLYNLLDSEFIQDLMELGVKPSDILSYVAENGNVVNLDGLKEFERMAEDFLFEASTGTSKILFGEDYDLTISDFFAYADKWDMTYSNAMRKEREFNV